MTHPPPPESTTPITAWAVTVPETAEDEASGLLWMTGCTGITIERADVGTIRLVCFYDDADAPAEAIAEVAASLGATASSITVPNPDWVQTFKETFVAFDVAPFRIVPEWIAPGAEGGSTNTPFIIRVDPGLAFGTGTHESTRLCLQTLGTLRGSLGEAPRVLDLGCGSGILGIATQLACPGSRVVGCDFDPLATEVAQKHVRLNHVEMDILLMDGCRSLRPGQFDLVLANLMAPFLISRVDEITAAGAPGCRYILAGLLRVEEDEVRAAWPRDWKVTATYQGEWASLLYERP